MQVKDMQLFKKIPFLLGWLIFTLSTFLVTRLLGMWRYSFFDNSFPRLTSNIYNFILPASLYVAIGFFAFMFSISKVALPLYWSGMDKYTKIDFGSYSLMWFTYLVIFLICSFPLAYNWFPAEIDRTIDIALQILASFFIYRGVVHYWLDDVISRHRKNKDKQVATTL